MTDTPYFRIEIVAVLIAPHVTVALSMTTCKMYWYCILFLRKAFSNTVLAEQSFALFSVKSVAISTHGFSCRKESLDETPSKADLPLALCYHARCVLSSGTGKRLEPIWFVLTCGCVYTYDAHYTRTRSHT